MLYSIDDLDHPLGMARAREFNAWHAGLTDDEYDAIVDDLRARIHGTEVQTSSWMPPSSDWTGTPFEPIYTKACHRNFDAAGLFFGLIVWRMFMDHEEDWSFGRYEKDGVPIRGLTKG